MAIYARINRIGWVHLWATREAFEEGEASAHFFNGRTDPRWAAVPFSPEQRRRLEAGELVELEDPGFLDEPEGSG